MPYFITAKSVSKKNSLTANFLNASILIPKKGNISVFFLTCIKLYLEHKERTLHPGVPYQRYRDYTALEQQHHRCRHCCGYDKSF
jgi:hypothetical protein